MSTRSEAPSPTSKTHAMRAVFELRKKILGGELKGGTRLYEVPLAEELEISRTPLRDAMSRLAEEGLLERGPSSGFIVRQFTFADVVDAIELRGVLEGTAARLAAERGVDRGLLARMEAIVADLDACFGPEPGAVDFEAYAEHNARFHEALGALAGSRLVQRELERVNGLPFASPSAFLPDKVDMSGRKGSLDLAQAQHREIVEAIKAREGARAEALAREHARTARRDLEYAMGQNGALLAQVASLALINA